MANSFFLGTTCFLGKGNYSNLFGHSFPSCWKKNIYQKINESALVLMSLKSYTQKITRWGGKCLKIAK